MSALALVVTAVATHRESATLTLRTRPLALVALVATDLMAFAFGGWALWWGDAAWQAIRLWAPAVLAGALAATAATGAFAARRRRHRLDHLVEALSKDPSGAGLQSCREQSGVAPRRSLLRSPAVKPSEVRPGHIGSHGLADQGVEGSHTRDSPSRLI